MICRQAEVIEAQKLTKGHLITAYLKEVNFFRDQRVIVRQKIQICLAKTN